MVYIRNVAVYFYSTILLIPPCLLLHILFHEGNGLAKGFAKAKVFDKSYVVRGAPAKADTSIRSWIIPSDSTLDEFFGDSAKYWAPKCWKKLRDSTAVAVAAAGTSSNGTAPV